MFETFVQNSLDFTNLLYSQDFVERIRICVRRPLKCSFISADRPIDRSIQTFCVLLDYVDANKESDLDTPVSNTN